MIPGTTPTYTLMFSESTSPIPHTNKYRMYLRQGNVKIVKTEKDLAINEDQNTVAVTLSQADSLRFTTGKLLIQLEGMDKDDGEVWSTPVMRATVEDSIITEVIQ